MRKRYIVIGLLSLVVAVMLALGPMAWLWVRGHLTRPPRTAEAIALFQGIQYERQARQQPRLLMVHIVTIDLTTPGVRLFGTPGKLIRGWEFPAQTTSEFVARFGLQLAINGNFFYPCFAKGFGDFYPQSGDPVSVLGLSMSDGVIYSYHEDDHPVFCVTQEGAEIHQKGCPEGTQQAVAGDRVVLEHGAQSIADDPPTPENLYPRTAVAIDPSGKTLWFIIIDGRQPGYSEGTTLAELATIGAELGADTVLNLDGGGSTTLVIADQNGKRSLNSPIHTRIPMRQRPIANHLGIYAQSQ